MNLFFEKCGKLSPNGYPNSGLPCALPKGHTGPHLVKGPDGSILAQSHPPVEEHVWDMEGKLRAARAEVSLLTEKLQAAIKERDAKGRRIERLKAHAKRLLETVRAHRNKAKEEREAREEADSERHMLLMAFTNPCPDCPHDHSYFGDCGLCDCKTGNQPRFTILDMVALNASLAARVRELEGAAVRALDLVDAAGLEGEGPETVRANNALCDLRKLVGGAE